MPTGKTHTESVADTLLRNTVQKSMAGKVRSAFTDAVQMVARDSGLAPQDVVMDVDRIFRELTDEHLESAAAGIKK